jgi:hypothetical protein
MHFRIFERFRQYLQDRCHRGGEGLDLAKTWELVERPVAQLEGVHRWLEPPCRLPQRTTEVVPLTSAAFVSGMELLQLPLHSCPRGLKPVFYAEEERPKPDGLGYLEAGERRRRLVGVGLRFSFATLRWKDATDGADEEVR